MAFIPKHVFLFAALAFPAEAAHWVRLESAVPVHDADGSSWVRGSTPPREHNVTMTVVVRIDDAQRNELERVFLEVSDPRHTRYGQHLSLEEVSRLLAVPEERVERVRSYFLSAGAHEAVASPGGDIVSVKMPTEAVEDALRTTLHFFSHRERRHARIVRASAGYSLPGDVAEDVTMVGELLQFPSLRPEPSTASLRAGPGKGHWPNACDAAECEGLVTPAVVAERYKLGTEPASAVKGNTMAIASFAGQYYKPEDLAAFGKSCHQNIAIEEVIGGNKDEAGPEAELDIEYIKSIAPEIPLTVIYTEDFSMLKWIDTVNSMQSPSLVQSVSYGLDEKQQQSIEYMYSSNTAFMKAGARGLTILASAGDSGACGRGGCRSYNGGRLHPDFPASSPYVTAVGGTDFAGDDIGPEAAWPAGGGGFSDTFPIPDYQRAAVEAYKSSPDAHLPPQKLWNATGRGYPDLAALGGSKTPICVNNGGSFTGVSGTSASCPIVAGIIAKLNGLRLAAGKPALGFLNPFIYQNQGAFQDVTSGTNSNGHEYGFTATKGWDATTGFGTPDFPALTKAVMAAAEQGSRLVVV